MVSKLKLIKYSKLIFVIIISVIFLHFLAFPLSNDYKGYIEYLYTLENSDLISSISSSRFELFSILTFWLISKVFTPATTLLFIGVIILYVKYLIFLEKFQRPMFAFVWYLLTFAYLHEGEQVRFAMASIFIIISLLSTKNKDSLIHFSMAVVGAGFHYSAFVVTFIIFLFALRPLVLIYILLFFWFNIDFFIAQLMIIEPLQPWLTFSIENQVALTNPQFMCQFFAGVILLFYWRELNIIQKRGAVLLIFGSLVYVTFLQNPIIAHRIRELSQIGIIGLIFVQSRWSSVPRVTTRLTALFFMLYSIFDIGRQVIFNLMF